MFPQQSQGFAGMHASANPLYGQHYAAPAAGRGDWSRRPSPPRERHPTDLDIQQSILQHMQTQTALQQQQQQTFQAHMERMTDQLAHTGVRMDGIDAKVSTLDDKIEQRTMFLSNQMGELQAELTATRAGLLLQHINSDQRRRIFNATCRTLSTTDGISLPCAANPAAVSSLLQLPPDLAESLIDVTEVRGLQTLTLRFKSATHAMDAWGFVKDKPYMSNLSMRQRRTPSEQVAFKLRYHLTQLQFDVQFRVVHGRIQVRNSTSAWCWYPMDRHIMGGDMLTQAPFQNLDANTVSGLLLWVLGPNTSRPNSGSASPARAQSPTRSPSPNPAAAQPAQQSPTPQAPAAPQQAPPMTPCSATMNPPPTATPIQALTPPHAPAHDPSRRPYSNRPAPTQLFNQYQPLSDMEDRKRAALRTAGMSGDTPLASKPRHSSSMSHMPAARPFTGKSGSDINGMRAPAR